ncbi:MFS transporter [Nakamurella sp. YIM 132087]|uniref:MFS transporter n=1 Tax=Nakamurella alba TaxID=2665158 RepID=A0A7K1FS35_9ACTN|nr:MFS transporter [Nakamurella alba]MTD16169.1 MFS transporter [Nakamurella alba]
MTTDTTAATITPTRPSRLSLRTGRALAAAGFLGVFAASGAPVALFQRYRERGLVTTGELSLATVAYFLGAMTALVALGRLSDHLGRKVVIIAAMLLAMAGTVVLLDVQGFGSLLVGRILAGLACGLAPGAMGSYLVDAAPPGDRLGPAVAGSGAMVGLTVGSLLTGALAQYGPSEHAGAIAVGVVLLVAAVLMALCPDTVPRRPGAWRSLRPRVFVPVQVRPLVPVVAAVAVATWALGGFYQAFGPVLAADGLGSHNTLVAAAVFSAFNGPAVIGGPLATRMPARTAQAVGIGVYLLAVVGILVSLHAGSVAWFLAVSVVAGVAQSMAFTAGLRRLLGPTAIGDRAGVISTVYLIAYSGAAVPGLIAGRLAGVFEISQILYGFLGLAVIAVAITGVFLRRTDPAAAPVTQPVAAEQTSTR